MISFINLLDTSATWVDISRCLYIWLRGQSRNVLYFFDNEMYVLIHGDFIIFCICNSSQAHFLFSVVKMVHLWGHDAIWRGVCHDLEEILWVPNFLYLSNMLSTIGVKELRFYTWLTPSSIYFNCDKSCSINSDELVNHQNRSDICWK